jgi:hypothetical protein
MYDSRNHAPEVLPVSNYSAALARAVEWLGDRYLLATPINTPRRPRRPAARAPRQPEAAGTRTSG